MSIAAFLSPETSARIRRILPSARVLHFARSWTDLATLLSKSSARTVIFDPAADGTFQLAAASLLIHSYPSRYFLAYVQLSSQSMLAVAELSRNGLDEVWIQGNDDALPSLRDRLQVVGLAPRFNGGSSVPIANFSELPSRLKQCLIALFDHPGRYATAGDLAIQAGISVSALYRSFHTALLISPKRMLIAAKAMHGYAYLREPGCSIRQIAHSLGYVGPRIFASHLADVFGAPPSRLRKDVNRREAWERLRMWINAPPAV